MEVREGQNRNLKDQLAEGKLAYTVRRRHRVVPLLILAGVVIKELYWLFAIPVMVGLPGAIKTYYVISVPGYSDPNNFFYLLTRAISYLMLIVAWRVSLGRDADKVYKGVIYALLIYGIVDMAFVLPWVTADYLNMGFLVAYIIVITPIIMIAEDFIKKFALSGYVENMERRLQDIVDANDRLEWHLDQMKRVNTRVNKEDFNKLRASMLKTLVMVEQMAEDHADRDQIAKSVINEHQKMNKTITEITKKTT